MEKNNKIILRFDGITSNLEKKATDRFITGIYFNNTNCNNNIIDFYYLMNFYNIILVSKNITLSSTFFKFISGKGVIMSS